MCVPGTRSTLWLAGAVAVGGGVLSMWAIRARTILLDEREARMEERGYFVVFEGGEGAGKSTQMDAFVRWMEARGEHVTTTREPGGTEIGARIRELLLDPELKGMDPRTEALLYASDRAQHVAEIVRPMLDKGEAVVSDRFVDSSLAYQGIARGLGLEQIYEISKWATGGLLPDVVFYLKIEAESALKRVGGNLDRIEGESGSFHERVAAAYERLAEQFPERFVVIEANRPPAEIHREIVAIFEDRTSGRFVSRATWPHKEVPR
jgi:dTMP kinase